MRMPPVHGGSPPSGRLETNGAGKGSGLRIDPPVCLSPVRRDILPRFPHCGAAARGQIAGSPRITGWEKRAILCKFHRELVHVGFSQQYGPGLFQLSVDGRRVWHVVRQHASHVVRSPRVDDLSLSAMGMPVSEVDWPDAMRSSACTACDSATSVVTVDSRRERGQCVRCGVTWR